MRLPFSRTLILLAVAVCAPATARAQSPTPAAQQAAHDEHGERPAPERIHRYDRQTVVLEDFVAEGYILDIGGGGEGIIGQLKPAQVVAIDLSARELTGAPPGPLKIVMDATDLKFLDETFGTATLFFTFMYMKPADQERAARELHRVLRPGGRLLVWDVLLPARFDPVKDIALYPLDITFLGRTVSTGYGTFFPERAHDLPYYKGVLERAGFTVTAQTIAGRTFYVEARKARTPNAGTP